MAQRKGQTGNPHGRPSGSKNKVSSEIKSKIESILTGSADEIQAAFDSITKPETKIKLFIEMAKIIIPRPQESSEETDAETTKNKEFIDRLFNRIN